MGGRKKQPHIYIGNEISVWKSCSKEWQYLIWNSNLQKLKEKLLNAPVPKIHTVVLLHYVNTQYVLYIGPKVLHILL